MGAVGYRSGFEEYALGWPYMAPVLYTTGYELEEVFE